MVAVQVKGFAFSFQEPMQSRICLIRTFPPEKVPRRMDGRVTMRNQVSIWLLHGDPTGVK